MWSSSGVIAVIISSTTVLLACLYIFFTWNFEYWRKRNVPYKTPIPFFGSLTFLLRKSPTDWFIEEYGRFRDADYYGIWIFRKPALVICSPELARKILVKDFEYFRDRFLSSGSSDPLGDLNIFTVNDPLWSTVRRRLTPVFTSSKLRNLLGMMNAYSCELVDRIRREHVLQNKPVDLRDIMACFTTDVIGAAAFGVRGDSVRTNDSPLRRITRQISAYTLRRGIEFSSIFFCPSLVNVFGFKFFTNEMSSFFKQVFWKIVKERSNETASKNKDLLDALLQIRKEALIDGSEDFTDDLLVAQAAIFVQGGFDTTAVFLSFFFYEIAHHSVQQQRLYQELQAAKPIVNGEVEYSTVKELPYLDMCMKETLRKYPAMGFLDRVADKDYNINKNLTVQKGTPVYVNAVGMHYSEKYFPNPKKWDPERFSANNEPNIIPFTYMPFGAGPRNCIGIRFAQQSAKILITQVMMNFEVRPKFGHQKPEDIQFDPKGVFLGPDRPLDVQFIDRKA